MQISLCEWIIVVVVVLVDVYISCLNSIIVDWITTIVTVVTLALFVTVNHVRMFI